jgi:hypothetical protein
VLSFVGLLRSPAGDAQDIAATPSFDVRIRDRKWEWEIAAAFVSQGEAVPIEVVGRGNEKYRVVAASGKLSRDGTNRWVWHAPLAPGLYPLTVTDALGRRPTIVNAFVMVPATAITHGRLNGYMIGEYPPRAVMKNRVVYAPPEGFIEVTPLNQATHLSPHFRLQDFLCKQPGGYPKYVVLREALIVKLEMLLRVVRRHGFDVNTLHLMSGYRTPSYNKAIGNVPYSMHLFGGAADVIADIDLNHDHLIDRQDAVALAGLVDELEHDSDSDVARGGLGIYNATKAHGPFVHVDVRAASARWGE